MLLLGVGPRVVAVDLTSRTTQWVTINANVDGVAVLGKHGVCVTCGIVGLHVFRLSDGRLVHTLHVGARAIVADESSGRVFVNLVRRESCIASYRWDGAALVQEGNMEAAGVSVRSFDRQLAVVPAVRGLHTSYLVVGGPYRNELLVLSLQDGSLVHTHDLRDGLEDVAGIAGVTETESVRCLAAFAAATTLAVVLETCVRLLPWQLRGMPALT
jgi:hypothetical protein